MKSKEGIKGFAFGIHIIALIHKASKVFESLLDFDRIEDFLLGDKLWILHWIKKDQQPLLTIQFLNVSKMS